MTFIDSILTGLFTGLGVGISQWITNNKINKALDRMDNNIKNLKNEKINIEGVTPENINEKIWGK